MNVWLVILGLAAWTYALRIAGPIVLNRIAIPERASQVLNNIAPAVLSALVVAGLFSSGRSLVLDERAFGFIAASVAVLAKLPPLAVIVAAAGTTAVARAVL